MLDYRNGQAIRATINETDGFEKLSKNEHLMRLLADMVSAANDQTYTPDQAMTVLHASHAKPAEAESNGRLAKIG